MAAPNRSRTQDPNAKKAKYKGGPNRGTTTSQNKSRKERIKKEIKRINEGGTTLFKGKKGALSSLKGKLKNVSSKLSSSANKKSKLKIAGAGDLPGATKAKAMAKARKDADKTIAQSHTDNMSSMRDAARARHKAFKESRKKKK